LDFGKAIAFLASRDKLARGGFAPIWPNSASWLDKASPMSDGCLFLLKRREISGPLIYKGIASRVMVRRQFLSPMSLVHRQHRFL
jgi:hypothetical protein